MKQPPEITESQNTALGNPIRFPFKAKCCSTEEPYNEQQVSSLLKHLNQRKKSLQIQFDFEENNETNKYDGLTNVICSEIEQILESDRPILSDSSLDEPESEGVTPDDQTDDLADVKAGRELTTYSLAEALYEIAPHTVYFNQKSGLLPGKIGISKTENGRYTLAGIGSTAARNFLKVAGLTLNDLMGNDERKRASLLARANSKITNDLGSFWSQTIGRKEKLKLECDVQTYGAENEEKAGTKYIVFWISDGQQNKLYPKQRSQGVIWFISFYLQLRASELGNYGRLFLLDEPGTNLHAKAQTDVIKLINKLSRDIPIVYSTHIPHMLEYDKFYRVLAVQRIGENDDSPTEIKTANELGTASSDTLSPVLTAMGVDLSNQEVIKKKRVIVKSGVLGFHQAAFRLF